MKDNIYSLTYELEENYWWYKARRRIIANELRKWIANTNIENPKLLDFGCGTGFNLLHFSNYCHTYGVDLSPHAVRFSQLRGIERVALLDPKQDIRDANPFDESFDIITLLDVLEHIPNDEQFLRSIAGWLKPNGMLLVTVPSYNFLWSGEDYVSQHVRRYTARSFADVFNRASYTIQRLTYFNTLLFPIQMVHILSNRLLKPRTMYETIIQPMSASLNSILTNIMTSEVTILNKTKLPFGGSILCLAEAPKI